MFLRRNVAGQTFTIPGKLLLSSDGSAVTSAASIYVNGTAGAAGTLAHWRGGSWRYTPAQAETDVPIFEYSLEAAGSLGLGGSVRTTNADPDDAQRLGLGVLPDAGTLLVKPAVTLAEADVAGELPANAVRLAGQSVVASASVAFPAAVASQSNAPSWYEAPVAAPSASAVAAAVWDFLQSSLGLGATMGRLLKSYGDYEDPWTATGTTLLSPAPTVNGFSVDPNTLAGSIALPAVCAVNLDAYRGRHFRLSSYDAGTGAVVLLDAMPTSPPTDASFSVEFQPDNPRKIDLTQPIADVQTATVGGALAASWAGSWGKMVLDRVAKMLRLWGPGNATGTASYNHSLDDADDPSNRTPAA